MLVNIEVFKRLGSETWENKYTVSTTDFPAGTLLWEYFAEMEKSIHATNVLIDYVRVSTAVEGDHVFATFHYGQYGTRAFTGGQLPLWNALRFDMALSGYGSPGRKYYRLPFSEQDVEDGLVLGGLVSALDTAWTNLFADLAPTSALVTDSGGRSVTGWTVHPRMVMRKLTRSRKKKVTTGGLVTGPS